MKRPAFQFYPADYRNNANLRRCSWEARGIWIEVLCLMHDSPEYGVLRWPIKEIALALGAPAKALKELVVKGVLKGGDRFEGAYTHRRTHARRIGDEVTLLAGDGGACWYSSRMVLDEWRRSVRGETSRFGMDSPAPMGGIGDCFGDAPKAPPSHRQGDGPSSSASNALTTTEASTIGLQARACVMMEEAGAQQANPEHPDLLAAIAEGVTLEALVATTREAVNGRKRNPFAWAVATARSRHAEGPKPATKPAAAKSTTAPTPSPQRPEDRAPRRRMGADSSMPKEAKDLAAALGIGRASQP